jgi:hypothetical protein
MLVLILGVRFALELVLLAVFGWWGFTISGGGPTGIVLGVLSASAVAILWGLLLSPKARITLHERQRTTVEILVFLTAAAMMATQGHPVLAAALVTGDLVVLLMLHLLGRDTGGRQRRLHDH